LHDIKVPEGMLPNRREAICSWFNEKVTPFLSKDEAVVINDYLNWVPSTNTFLHCDFHAKNVMEVKGELMLIDIGDAAVGHPVFDLAHMTVGTIILARSVRSGFLSKEVLGYDPADAETMFNRHLMAYLNTDDTDAIELYKHTFMPMAHLVNLYHASSYLNTDTLNPVIIRTFLVPEMFSELSMLNKL
jgi:thiamine kinase-like enzyme